MLCEIWNHLHNLKNVINIHGGVLLLVKLQASLNVCFSRFSNCTNDTKLRKASVKQHFLNTDTQVQ